MTASDHTRLVQIATGDDHLWTWKIHRVPITSRTSTVCRVSDLQSLLHWRWLLYCAYSLQLIACRYKADCPKPDSGRYLPGTDTGVDGRNEADATGATDIAFPADATFAEVSTEHVRLGSDASKDGPDMPTYGEAGAENNGWVLDCNGTIGRYGDGVVIAGATAAFEAAYLRHYPQIGCPFGNGGSAYVHTPCAGVDVQDYFQADSSKAISTSGQTMLILNSGLSDAFLLYDSFWLAYACLETDQCNGMGGASLLGPPIDEKHADGALIRQDFARGWMSLDATGSGVTIHLNEHQVLHPGLLSGCSPDGGGPSLQVSNPDLPEAANRDAGGRPVSCAQPTVFDNPTATNNASAAVPSCSLDQSGAVVLDYADTDCSASDGPYRGCEFAGNQNIMPFDPLQGNSGLYEVFFCVEGPVNGSINIWYQQGDCSSCRYYLPLLTAGDTLQGCRRVYVAPGDVNRNASWGPNQYCFARGSNTSSSTSSCMDILDSGVLDAPVVDASYSKDGTLGAGAGSVADGATADATQERPDFSRSTLVLMNEWCDPTKPRPDAGGTVRITVESVIYHPAQCLCANDGDCQQPALCQHIAWPAGACCECGTCPGLCQ